MGHREREFGKIGWLVLEIYPKVLDPQDLREIFYHLVEGRAYLGAIDNMVPKAETLLADSAN
jgi:hypothetical protein